MSENEGTLRRIRAMLAQAEDPATTPAEAAAFSAKAEDLIIRYAIDAALLENAGTGGRTTPELRAIFIDNPYPLPKATLINAIALTNRCKLVRVHDGVKVIGFPVDLDAVEMLFTSLLVQATHAMLAQDTTGMGPAGSRSFRTSFMYGFAAVVKDRLEAIAARQATEAGAGTALVLVNRTKDVDAEFKRQFPHTVTSKSHSRNGAGHRAGGHAGANANLGQSGVGHRQAVGA